MPTEDFSDDQARRLLAKAAATIDVEDTAPITLTGLPEPGPRRWPVLAAVAAVVLAIGGGVVVAQHLGDDPQPAPAPVSSDSEPVDEETGLVDDQLPGLIGYTEQEAIELLQKRGYAVEVHIRPDGCNVPGIVTGTSPPVGTRMEPGDPVTIRVVGQQAVIDCVGEEPWDTVWDLVRFARGLGKPPDHVVRADISDEALDALAGLVTQEWPGQASPRLAVAHVYDGGPCWQAVPGDNRLRLWVQVPDQAFACPATSVLLRYQGDGDLVGVELATDSLGPADPLELFPVSPERLESAEAFVGWAQGPEGFPAPRFAERVRHIAGGFSPRWNREPEWREGWAGCSGLGFPDCGIDPVGAVRVRGAVRFVAGSSDCAPAAPTRFADAQEDVVRIERAGGGCALVELWIDDGGVIYAVRQVGGYRR